jgi:hypothetical protein
MQSLCDALRADGSLLDRRPIALTLATAHSLVVAARAHPSLTLTLHTAVAQTSGRQTHSPFSRRLGYLAPRATFTTLGPRCHIRVMAV